MMAATPEAIGKIMADNAPSSAETQLSLKVERNGNVAVMTLEGTTLDAARRATEETKRKAETEMNARIVPPIAEVKETAEAERKRLEDIIAALTANITTLREKAEDEAAESRMSIARAEAQRVEALAVADAEWLARVEAEARVTAAREEAERLKSAEESRKKAEAEAAKARAKAVEDEENDPLQLVLKVNRWW
jgi:cell division septum initiation protein DivIVA